MSNEARMKAITVIPASVILFLLLKLEGDILSILNYARFGFQYQILVFYGFPCLKGIFRAIILYSHISPIYVYRLRKLPHPP
jgi:hypothetical protein